MYLLVLMYSNCMHACGRRREPEATHFPDAAIYCIDLPHGFTPFHALAIEAYFRSGNNCIGRKVTTNRQTGKLGNSRGENIP
jgi:hypothetical protein